MLARAGTGEYNRSDTQNHAMLNGHYERYSTRTAPDARLLHTWHEGAAGLFRPTKKILSLCNFIIMAEDGEVDLGVPIPPPDELKEFPFKGSIYPTSCVLRESEKVTERTLLKVLPIVLDGSFTGLRYYYNEGNEPPSPRGVLPKAFFVCRLVWLFLRRSEEEKMCIGQER